MKNLDQIRAHNALKHKDRIGRAQGGGDAVSGFPMLVRTDGLLGALAFACERRGQQGDARKHPGEHTVATAIAEHLHADGNRIATASTADDLMVELAGQADDTMLRRATAESLAFLNYLKRFVA